MDGEVMRVGYKCDGDFGFGYAKFFFTTTTRRHDGWLPPQHDALRRGNENDIDRVTRQHDRQVASNASATPAGLLNITR